MPSIKELRSKIGSLKNTSKITSAMKLVSSAKLKKTQDAWNRNQSYANSLHTMVDRILQTDGATESALLRQVKEVKTITVLVLTSDKGLCGSFNSSLLKLVQNKIRNEWKDYRVEVVAVGKKATDFFSHRCHVPALVTHPGFPPKVPVTLANQYGDEVIAQFVGHKTDLVYLAYNLFQGVVTQEATVEQLLPIVHKDSKKTHVRDYILEPNEKAIFERVFPQLVHATIYRAMLSSAVGEQAARMNAMDNATRNSKDLIQRYTLVMNRARQTSITTELSEIVAGAESLKG